MTDTTGADGVRIRRGREVTDRLRADTYRRESVDDAPIVVFVYGGAWETGARGQFARWALDAASEGFLGVEIEYRRGDEATFPAQIRDVRRSLAWVRAEAERLGGNPDRVAVVGHSAGAHLALLAALAPTDAFGGEYETDPAVHAAVGVSGPYDLRGDESLPVRRLLGGRESEIPDRYAAASPVTHVSSAAPPALLLHGADDEVVPAASSEALAEALDAADAPVELRVEPGADHVYLHSSYWYPELRETVFSWIRTRR